MYRFASSAIFLLAGTLAFGQSKGSAPTVVKTLRSPATIDIAGQAGCPIGFSASRQSDLQMMSASDASKAGPAQGLHLTLNNLDMPAIQNIEVTVYGTSTKGRVLPVDMQSNDTVTKTFALHRISGDASLSDADVWMHHVGSLSWVDLISITYADGTTWHAAENLKCRAVPSNFLLVGRK
jgi:hypothetical protein